jgi:hypothetical protein
MDLLTNKRNRMLAGGIALTVVAASGWGVLTASRHAPQNPGTQEAMSIAPTQDARARLIPAHSFAAPKAGGSVLRDTRQDAKEAVGPDPFYVQGPEPTARPIAGPKVGNPALYRLHSKPSAPPHLQFAEDSALKRVSGILHGANGVFAVVETDGISRMVQPGDVVSGALVLAIQNDGIMLRTKDDRIEQVPLSSAPQGVLAQ